MTTSALPKDRWVVEPEWLAGALDSPDIRVLDCTTVMTPQAVGASRISSGRPQYLAAHIPGAVHACMVEDFSDPAGAYPYTLPRPEQLSATLSRLGISAEHHVVLVVAAQPMVATRVWWVLRALGHARVSILNGGMSLWRAQGRPLVSGEERHAASHFEACLQPGWCVDAEAVAEAMSDPQACLLNALSREQFRGEGGAHYGRPGHIPGSISLPAAQAFEADSMIWRSREQLRALFQQAGLAAHGQRVITYCGGGIAASVIGFALRWADWADAQLYDNSLLEWSADARRPMALGDAA